MHFHNFGSANVVGIHSGTNLQKENIFYPITGIIDIPNMQHTVLFNIGFGIGMITGKDLIVHVKY